MSEVWSGVRISAVDLREAQRRAAAQRATRAGASGPARHRGTHRPRYPVGVRRARQMCRRGTRCAMSEPREELAGLIAESSSGSVWPTGWCSKPLATAPSPI